MNQSDDRAMQGVLDPQAQPAGEQRETFAAAGEVNPAGEFEVAAITAGDGNGWRFDEAVLRASLGLWDGVSCFIDHSYASRSIRDLAGMASRPGWDATRRGVKVTLKAVGPSGPLLRELGRQVLGAAGRRPKIGFSADVLFTARGKEVVEILKVNSLDLVFNPARGGEFIRMINSIGVEMSDMVVEGVPAGGGTLESVQLSAQQAQMSKYLLDLGLQAAKLPAAMEAYVRAQFEGQTVDPAALNAAIGSARKLVTDLTGSAVVQGPGRIHGMFDSRDQIQAAVDDLFEVPRDESLKALKAAKLQGIRELYLTLTGDYDFHGGFYADRAQLATTADFTGLVKNALNKIVVNTWDVLGRAGYDWWTKVTTVEHFNTLNSITGTLVGTVGDLPVVAEGGAYTELVVGDSPETASFTKYGGYIPLTLELIDRDETRKLKVYARELASAGLRKVSKLVAAIFTANGGVGPTLADTGALFNATAVTDAGGAGHANLLTTALAAAQWEVVASAMYAQPMLIKNAAGVYGTGPKMAVNPKYLMVPRQLQLTAMKILYPTLENAAQIYSENQQRGQPGDVVTVPEWTDATDWAAVIDPRVVPSIYVGERFGIMPEVFIAGDELSPAVFTNDEHRLKVRHFLAVWVNDFRALHKSNVAG